MGERFACATSNQGRDGREVMGVEVVERVRVD